MHAICLGMGLTVSPSKTKLVAFSGSSLDTWHVGQHVLPQKKKKDVQTRGSKVQGSLSTMPASVIHGSSSQSDPTARTDRLSIFHQAHVLLHSEQLCGCAENTAKTAISAMQNGEANLLP